MSKFWLLGLFQGRCSQDSSGGCFKIKYSKKRDDLSSLHSKKCWCVFCQRAGGAVSLLLFLAPASACAVVETWPSPNPTALGLGPGEVLPPKAALLAHCHLVFPLHGSDVAGEMGTSKSSWSPGSRAGAAVAAAGCSSPGAAPASSCWDAEPAWDRDGEGGGAGAFLYATA